MDDTDLEEIEDDFVSNSKQSVKNQKPSNIFGQKVNNNQVILQGNRNGKNAITPVEKNKSIPEPKNRATNQITPSPSIFKNTPSNHESPNKSKSSVQNSPKKDSNNDGAMFQDLDDDFDMSFDQDDIERIAQEHLEKQKNAQQEQQKIPVRQQPPNYSNSKQSEPRNPIELSNDPARFKNFEDSKAQNPQMFHPLPENPQNIEYDPNLCPVDPEELDKDFTELDPDGLPNYRPSALRSLKYPTSDAKQQRDFQMKSAADCLVGNTLVVLPTGLGKTFIASVVMLNYYHYFPAGKIVFMAPTRPLVTQQIHAFYQISRLPRDEIFEMRSKITKNERKKYWNEKRIFFSTPQIVEHGLFALFLFFLRPAHRNFFFIIQICF